jgi:hypothetical protein
MLLVGGAGGYLIRKGEEGGAQDDVKSKTISHSTKIAEPKPPAY